MLLLFARFAAVFIVSCLIGIAAGVSGAQAMLGEPITLVRWARQIGDWRPRLRGWRVGVHWALPAYAGWSWYRDANLRSLRMGRLYLRLWRVP